MVDEHTRELVADRLVHEQRGNSRVDAAREGAENALVADLGADALDLLLDHGGGGPGRRGPRNVVEEVLQDRLAVWGVHDFGMELDAVELSAGVLEGGNRRVLGRGDGERTRGRLDDRVAMRHPGRLILWQGRKQRALARAHPDLSVLARTGLIDAPAQLEREQLGAVADAECGNAELEDRWVDLRGAVCVDRRRATGEDQRDGIAPPDLGDGRAMGNELRVHARLTHTTCDQL